jgi:hypothetical protein
VETSDDELRECLIEEFGLNEDQFEITSPFDPLYNCVAWALNDKNSWWGPKRRWPSRLERRMSLTTIGHVFEDHGFEVLKRKPKEFSDDYEYVAVYAERGRFTRRCGDD